MKKKIFEPQTITSFKSSFLYLALALIVTSSLGITPQDQSQFAQGSAELSSQAEELAAKAAMSKAQVKTSNQSPESWVVCKYQAQDTGLIQFRGKDYDQAFRRTANKCFQVRQAIYKNKNNNKVLGEDPGVFFIELCTNKITCS